LNEKGPQVLKDDFASTFMKKRAASRRDIYLKLVYDTKIRPLVEEQLAEEEAQDPSINLFARRARRIRIQNAILSECFSEETPEVKASVEEAYRKELAMKEMDEAHMQMPAAGDSGVDGSPQYLQQYVL
jgi:CRISPR/Cas system-associated exonuclease Cas4 (RecB family)